MTGPSLFADEARRLAATSRTQLNHVEQDRVVDGPFPSLRLRHYCAMTLVQDLLNRISRDREFGPARLEIGYRDRIGKTLGYVPIAGVSFRAGGPFFLETATPDGIVRRASLLSVHAGWRNGTGSGGGNHDTSRCVRHGRAMTSAPPQRIRGPGSAQSTQRERAARRAGPMSQPG
jgi:hypothetical protein